MTEQQHPIVPPPKQVAEWRVQWCNSDVSGVYEEWLAARSAEFGADQELEAILARLRDMGFDNLANDLLAARRPKPPSLKELALAELAEWENVMDIAPDNPIRRALKQLPE